MENVNDKENDLIRGVTYMDMLHFQPNFVQFRSARRHAGYTSSRPIQIIQ